MTSGEECSSREKPCITSTTTGDDDIVKIPRFDLTEASTAITDLSLTSLLVGDFFVILNCKPDVMILGEPYLALMVLMELKSGKYIRRIWNRTVGKGTSQTIDHLVDLCKKHFFQGKPCIGFPQNGKEEDDCNFLTTQTPIPRKISRFCHEVLGIDAKDEDHLCPECRELGNNEEQTSNDIKVGEADIKYEHEELHETNKIGSSVENAEETLTLVPGMHDEPSPYLSCKSDEIKEEFTQKLLSSGRPRASPKGRSTKITYGTLITEAITNSDKKMLPLSHIYQYIANKYPYFKMENNSWQNSIRHNLSLNKKFMKVDCPGLKRGCLWAIVGGAHNVNDADVVEDALKSEIDEGSKAPENHQEVEVKCIWCNKGFQSKNTLNEHEKTHQVETNDTDVDCPSCKESIKVTDINTHYEHCSNSSPDGLEIQCKACGKSFQQYNELVGHMKAHMRAEGVKVPGLYHSCDKCDRRFTERARLNLHIRAEHDKILYTCSECPMTFKYKYKYYQHKNISHSSDKRYNCKHCGKRFGHLSQVRSHERIHEGPKFQCRFCSKMLRSEGNLVEHERLHMGEKPFVCEECGNGYASIKGLTQHQQYMHTEDKRQQMRDTMKRWRLKQGQKEDPSEHLSKI